MKVRRRMIPVLFAAWATAFAYGCATAAHKTNEVTEQTAETTGSVFSGLESVILYPFHLIGDLFQ